MKVICHYRTDPKRSLTDPLPEKKWSFVFRLYSGDVCDPLGGDWFGPNYPTHVMRYFCKWPVLPFIAWRFNNKAGYAGFKLYGVDSPEYLKWPIGIKQEDVFDGSQALCFTARPFASV